MTYAIFLKYGRSPSKIKKLYFFAKRKTSLRLSEDVVTPVGLHPYYHQIYYMHLWKVMHLTGTVYSTFGVGLFFGQFSSAVLSEFASIPSASVLISIKKRWVTTTNFIIGSSRVSRTYYFCIQRLKNGYYASADKLQVNQTVKMFLRTHTQAIPWEWHRPDWQELEKPKNSALM